MADRIKNYQQASDGIDVLKSIRTDLGVTPSSYTPDTSVVTKDRVVTFAQAEEELSVLGDIGTGIKQQVVELDIAQKDIKNIKALLNGTLYDYSTDNDEKYTKTVPSGAMPYAALEKVGGETVVWNQLVDTGTTTVNTISGHKYYTLIDGTASIVTSDGTAISVVDDTADMVCDLTLMLGSGNEFATTDDFTEVFPATHYAYNSGTLLSAGVTSVISYVLLPITLLQGYIEADGTYRPNWYRTVVTDYISVTPGSTIKCSIESGKLIQYITEFYANKTVKVWSSNYLSTNVTRTVSDETAYIRVTYQKDDANENLYPTDITNVSVMQVKTYSIPAEIQALVGYGWSAGNSNSYIDYEAKLFVKCVSSVDLGTLTWTKVSDYFYSSDLSSLIKHVANNDTVADIVCSNYVSDTRNNIIENVVDKAVCSSANGYTIVVRDTAYVSYTEAQFKTAMSGVTLFYGLKTPIEIDISAYLTDDNLIEVGAGGTLEFPNSNGADYLIPVPSTEEYMIDLQNA